MYLLLIAFLAASPTTLETYHTFDKCEEERARITEEMLLAYPLPQDRDFTLSCILNPLVI